MGTPSEPKPLESKPVADIAPLPFILTSHQEQVLREAMGLEPGKGKLIFRVSWDQLKGAEAATGVQHKFNDHFAIGAEAGWNQKVGAQAVVVGQIVWEP